MRLRFGQNRRINAVVGTAGVLVLMLVPAVLAGLGIALLPDFLIHDHLTSGAMVTVMDDYPMPEAGVYVVRPPGGSAPCKVRVLIDIMVEKFAGQQCPGSPAAKQ